MQFRPTLATGAALAMAVLLSFVAHALTPTPQSSAAPPATSPAPAAPSQTAPAPPPAASSQTAPSPAPLPVKQPVKRPPDPRDNCITPKDAESELLNRRRQIGGGGVVGNLPLPPPGQV